MRGVGPAGRLSAGQGDLLLDATTRSASARTARPISRSSSWPPCGPCPGLRVIRPADANETAHALRVAIERDGPTALILTPAGPCRSWPAPPRGRPRSSEGAYVLRRRRRRSRRGPDRHRVGSVGLRGRRRPAGRARGSPPGWCPCRAGSSSTSRTTTTRTRCSGTGAPVLSVEAAASFGWSRWADDSVAIDHFGASAPGRRRCWPSSASPPTTSPNGPGPCSRTAMR